jgi:hypothetical protein
MDFESMEVELVCPVHAHDDTEQRKWWLDTPKKVELIRFCSTEWIGTILFFAHSRPGDKEIPRVTWTLSDLRTCCTVIRGCASREQAILRGYTVVLDSCNSKLAFLGAQRKALARLKHDYQAHLTEQYRRLQALANE